MSDVVIRAAGLGKRYLIGHQSADRESYTALRDVIGRSLRGLGRSAIDIMRGRQVVGGDEVEEFWALKDISFEIKRGEVVGIIGRNGAGKSTLLKILSRITEPTAGRVEIKGRVASLLEVGTGFHPELTGRENIFLNGAILGMSRAEIRAKFDEIVAFSGVEKFLDTPVKRYSSGMYVRLAFAVAAHLEPEILVVDEVLAVGDAEFQEKCLGKMHDIAGQGRTVLFVSHNMAAIASLTERAIILDRGEITFFGATSEAVKTYAALSPAGTSLAQRGPRQRGRHASVLDMRLLDEKGETARQYVAGTPLRIEVMIETDGTRGLSCDVLLADQNKAKIALGSLSHFEGKSLPEAPGIYRLLMSFAPLNLAAGNYSFDVATSIINQSWDHYLEDAIAFEVLYSNPAQLPWNFVQSYGYGSISMPVDRPTHIERLDGGREAVQ